MRIFCALEELAASLYSNNPSKAEEERENFR